nr:DUF433 domain-containing protein [Pyrinomonadaceae bacterium]
KPCIRGTRVTVETLVGLIAAGKSFEKILCAYPYLVEEDLRESLLYAEQCKKEKSSNKRLYGLSKGKFTTPKDFDAPLPKDAEDTFN